MTERTCVFCNGKADKENLLRWVLMGGRLFPDWTGKADGRAVYTHYDKKCVCGIYGARKLSSAFGGDSVSFGIPETEILEFVRSQAEKSFDYYFSICRKSGVLLKGQNLLAEEIEKGTVFSALLFASDASERTCRELERKAGTTGGKLHFTKDELGKKFDGRGVSAIAMKPSKQSEKFMFYMNLLNNFTSGDI